MSREKQKSLHSSYNPQAEADRYVTSLSLSEKTRFFILIEPGLGYMIAPLKKRAPSAKIVTLHAGEYSTHELSAAHTGSPDAEWHPGTGLSVQDFLEREIPDSEAAEIQILEWRPALTVFGKAYLTLVEEAVSFIKRSDANARTTKAFAQRWVRNFFKNLEIIGEVLRPGPLSLPIVVTGAGPGLESSVPLIREELQKGELFILAASSSVMALESADITPDLVISTDGGNWAKMHLYECYRDRTTGNETLPRRIAASLIGALPSQSGTGPILPISDGSIWQTLILKELNIPFIALPQRGTVSASALDLAFALTTGSVFIAGMDLENHDIRSHSRPYSLDRLMEEKAQRLNPLYSQVFRRSSMVKAGGSYGIYASWFEKQLSSFPKRLHTLGKNNSVFRSLKPGPSKTTQNNASFSAPCFETLTLPSRANTAQKAVRVLTDALNGSAHSAVLREELSSLLFSGKTDVSSKELIDNIHSLSGTAGN